MTGFQKIIQRTAFAMAQVGWYGFLAVETRATYTARRSPRTADVATGQTIPIHDKGEVFYVRAWQEPLYQSGLIAAWVLLAFGMAVSFGLFREEHKRLMRKPIFLLPPIICFAAFIAYMVYPSFAKADSVAQSASPVELSAQWAAGWSAKDLDGLMALYAPAPVFLTASGERWEGAASIRAHFAEGLAEYNPQLAVKSLKSEASGGLAYDSGSYEETTTAVHGSGGAIHAKGSYLFVFQRQKDGGWKILEQIWTQRGVARL